MYELTVKHKFNSGDVVYFMNKNEVCKGVVAVVEFDIKTVGFGSGYYIRDLFKGLLKSFDKNRKYNITLRYNLDKVTEIDGETRFAGCPYRHFEDEIFSTKKELLASL